MVIKMNPGIRQPWIESQLHHFLAVWFWKFFFFFFKLFKFQLWYLLSRSNRIFHAHPLQKLHNIWYIGSDEHLCYCTLWLGSALDITNIYCCYYLHCHCFIISKVPPMEYSSVYLFISKFQALLLVLPTSIQFIMYKLLSAY